MNLLGRCSAGLFFLSAMFFFSCDDELNKIGNDSGQDKFDLLYKEFILPSKVVLFDSVRTDNTTRLLVGDYEDPIFGSIKSTAYSVFGTNDTTNVLKDAVIDSVILNLNLDFYHYGRTNEDQLEMSFDVHKITEQISSSENHFNYSSATYDNSSLGNIKFRFFTDSLDYFTTIDPDTSLVVSLKLPNEYVVQLTQVIQNINKLSEVDDQLFGFALVPSTGDNIIGFGTTTTASSLSVHYRDASVPYKFSLFTTNAFNQIESDRTGGPLEGLTNFSSGEELDGMRYVQGATGIYTQLDLSPYLSFFNSLDNALINSAEIVVNPVMDFTNLRPPTNIALYHSNDNYKFERLVTSNFTYDWAFTDNIRSLEQFNMLFSTDDNDIHTYSGFPTLYFQSLYDNEVEDANLVMVPAESSSSLHRTSFHKDNIKLKIYYTIPIN